MYYICTKQKQLIMTAEDFINAEVITVDSVPFWEYKEGLNEFEVENSLGLFELGFYYQYNERKNEITIDVNPTLKHLDNNEEPEIKITHEQVKEWISKQINF